MARNRGRVELDIYRTSLPFASRLAPSSPCERQGLLPDLLSIWLFSVFLVLGLDVSPQFEHIGIVVLDFLRQFKSHDTRERK